MLDKTITCVEGGRRLGQSGLHGRPLVSIISVILNAADELTQLLESILAHRGDETELIVIDGGSCDGTLEVLRRFDTEIDYWISEPDKGIYDAMNRGIALATGEYVLHLNAGDRLLSIPAEILRSCTNDQIDVAAFAVLMKGWGEFRPRSGFLLRIENTWHHQGTFYRRSTHPGYDLQYRVFSDFDCNQKMMKAGRRVGIFRQVIAEQRSVGISGSGMGRNEKIQIVCNNFGILYASLAVLWGKTEQLQVLLKRALTGYERLVARRPSQ